MPASPWAMSCMLHLASFPLAQWLGLNVGDGQLERTLLAQPNDPRADMADYQARGGFPCGWPFVQCVLCCRHALGTAFHSMSRCRLAA